MEFHHNARDGTEEVQPSHLMHRLQIIISKTNHPTVHVLSGNIFKEDFDYKMASGISDMKF